MPVWRVVPTVSTAQDVFQPSPAESLISTRNRYELLPDRRETVMEEFQEIQEGQREKMEETAIVAFLVVHVIITLVHLKSVLSVLTGIPFQHDGVTLTLLLYVV